MNTLAIVYGIPFAIALYLLHHRLPEGEHLWSALGQSWSLVGNFTIYVFCFYGFINNGTAVAARLFPKETKIDRLALGVIASCVLGYAAFWIHFAHPRAGFFAAVLFCVATAWITIRNFRYKRNCFSKDLAAPVRLTFFAGVFYYSLLNLSFVPMPQTEVARYRFFQGPLPGDNAIPMTFAGRLVEGSDPRAISGNWKSSDRPPLQTGNTLLFKGVFTPAFTEANFYNTFAILQQLVWLIGLYQFFALFKFSGKLARFATVVCLFSGFFFVNSVYTWPKLLAAGLGLIAFNFLWRGRETGARRYGAFAGAAFALAMLSHGGVFFSLPSLAWAWLGKKWNAAQMGVGLVAGIFLFAPWVAYQKWYDPPGDRLVKFHLAKVEDPDPRSSGVVIAEAYGKKTISEILYSKWRNVAGLWGERGWSGINEIAEGEFFHLFRALEFLNVGWIFLIGLVVKKRTLRRFTGGAMASLLFWILLMFGPGTTILHHGSYLTFLMIYVMLAVAIFRYSARLAGAVMYLNLVGFGVLWIGLAPVGRSVFDGGLTNPFMWLTAVLGIRGILHALEDVEGSLPKKDVLGFG